jgi:hypothetical protein
MQIARSPEEGWSMRRSRCSQVFGNSDAMANTSKACRCRMCLPRRDPCVCVLCIGLGVALAYMLTPKTITAHPLSICIAFSIHTTNMATVFNAIAAVWAALCAGC